MATKKEKTEPKFTKEQLLKSKRFRYEVDLVDALLDSSKTYSIEEVETEISNYLKGTVN